MEDSTDGVGSYRIAKKYKFLCAVTLQHIDRQIESGAVAVCIGEDTNHI